LPRFRDEPELLHHAQNVVAVLALRYLDVGEPLGGDARYLHPVARSRTQVLCLALVGTMSAKGRHHLGPFGHLIFQGAGEVGEDAAHGGGELLGAFYASYVSGGGVVADEVGGIDLLRDIQVAPLERTS
jgi:hypothetical protein